MFTSLIPSYDEVWALGWTIEEYYFSFFLFFFKLYPLGVRVQASRQGCKFIVGTFFKHWDHLLWAKQFGKRHSMNIIVRSMTDLFSNIIACSVISLMTEKQPNDRVWCPFAWSSLAPTYYWTHLLQGQQACIRVLYKTVELRTEMSLSTNSFCIFMIPL